MYPKDGVFFYESQGRFNKSVKENDMPQIDQRKNKEPNQAEQIFSSLKEKKAKESVKKELRYKHITVGGVGLVIKKFTATERFQHLPQFMSLWYSTSAALATQQGVDYDYYKEGLEPSSTLSAAELTMAYIEKFQDVNFDAWVKEFCSNVFLKGDKEEKPLDFDDTFNLDENPIALIELIEEVARANFMIQLSQAILLMPHRLQMENN